MACYHPIPAYQDGPGARVILWPRPIGSESMHLPCGTCLGCRTDLATEWAHRAQLEASQWEHNCFVTLTYDEEHLPDGAHLRPKDLQRFIKRLRRRLNRRDPAIATTPVPRQVTKRLPKGVHGPRQLVTVTEHLRYLASGEYGDKTLRPHFHVLLFNCTFNDLRQEAKRLYSSPTLRKAWKLGEHRIGQLTGASANYVAQYSLKKLVTPVERHDDNGEVYHPPFIRMSLKPAIGKPWLDKFKGDLQHGYLVQDARKSRIPRGIKKQLAKLDPQLAEQSQHNAQQHKQQRGNLEAAEIIHHRRNQLLNHRPLE